MDIAQKKKEKKERQRVKKNENSHPHSDQVDDADIMILSDSAFVQSVVKKKKGESKNFNVNMNDCNVEEPRNRDYSYLDCASIPDDLQGFTTVVRDKGVHKPSSEQTPEGYRKRGYDLILRNEKPRAIQYLSKAIEFDPTDIRNFINRSYCYLNTGEYSRAIDDIHRIIAHISDEILLSKMKCREAQALVGMKNYDGALECFNDSLNFMPNSAAVKCERLRMKVVELTSLGFPETEVLELLHGDLEITIKDAVTYLCYISTDAPTKIGLYESIEDDIYHSDNDEYPSNTRRFMDIVGFDNENEDDSWHENSRTPRISDDVQWRIKKTPTATNELKVIKAAAVSKSLTKKKICEPEDKSVWVGEINPNITESVLMKHFAKFGKVLSVVIRSSKYAFVNFQETNSAQKAIAALSIKIGAAVLPIKPGRRAK